MDSAPQRSVKKMKLLEKDLLRCNVVKHEDFRISKAISGSGVNECVDSKRITQEGHN